MKPNLCTFGLAWPRLLRALAGLWLATLLVGCGPGVGGTGTGDGATEDPLPAFGASAAALCDSELAGVLDCAPGAGAPAPATGSRAVALADSASDPRVAAQVAGNRIELQAPCTQAGAGLRFSGVWGAVAGEPARFYGVATLASGPAPAVLLASVSGGGLRVELLDAQGLPLLAPTLLVTVPAPTAPRCS